MTPYVIDHDLHIHSRVSLCSSDSGQTPEAIHAYAVKNGFSTVCLTDHFWDRAVPISSRWYEPRDIEDIRPELPQKDGVRFLFGVETEMDMSYTIGLSAKTMEKLDFIIVPTTHLHMDGLTIPKEVGFDEDGVKRRRELYVERFSRLLDADLPFHKTGVAHLSCELICNGCPGGAIKVLEGIPDSTFRELFARAAKKGLGIELNLDLKYDGEYKEIQFRPYRIAKQCGCKFYLGSDAHHPADFARAIPRFEESVRFLGLGESDKFTIK